MARARKAQYIYPLLLLVGELAFILRLHRLDAQSLRGDEILGMLAIQTPFADMFATEALVDHPPLYFFILRLWIEIAGQSDFAIRFLSVFFGALTVLLIYQIGRCLFSARVGLFAAIVAAVSPFFVMYSQEARAYALAFFFATASAYLVLKLVERADLRVWLLWAGVSLLALFSEYMAGQIVAFGELFILVCLLIRRPSLWRCWLLAQVIVVLPLVTWLYFSRAVTNVYAYDSAAWGFNLGDALRQTAITFSTGAFFADQTAFLFTFLFLGVAAFGLLHCRRQGRYLLFCIGYLFIPIGITYVVSLGKLGFSPRHVLFAMPAYFLLIACGLAWMRRRSWLFFAPGLTLVMAGSAVFLVNYYYNSLYGREELRGMSQYVTDRARPGDLVVFTSPWGERMFRYYSQAPVQTIGIPAPNQRDPARIESRLGEAVAEHDRVWLVLYDPSAADPRGIVESWLGKNAYGLGTKGFTGVIVRSFLAKPPIMATQPRTQRSVDVSFERKLRLVGYDVDDAEAPTKGRLHIALYWLGLQSMEENYRIQVRLVDNRQRAWASRDHRPVADTLPTTKWPAGMFVRDEYELQLPSGAPPGRYSAVVRVYDAADGRTLSSEQVAGQVVIGGVDVPRRVVSPLLDRHDMQVRAQRDFGEVELLGYNIWGGSGIQGTRLEARGGDEITVSTLWRAKSRPSGGLGISLQLEGQGRAFRSTPEPAGGWYPSDRWQAGELVRDFRTLVVDPELPAGSYRLLASVEGRGQVDLGVVDLQGSSRVKPQGTGTISVGRTLGGLITLLGYDVKPPPGTIVRPGSTLELDLYWKAEKKIGNRYTVFTHLVGSAENIVSQHDAEPGQGAHQTTGWLPGDVVPDRHDIVVGPNVPPGVYRLFAGLYDAKSGERLALPDGENRLLLAEVRLDGNH